MGNYKIFEKKKLSIGFPINVALHMSVFSFPGACEPDGSGGPIPGGVVVRPACHHASHDVARPPGGRSCDSFSPWLSVSGVKIDHQSNDGLYSSGRCLSSLVAVIIYLHLISPAVSLASYYNQWTFPRQSVDFPTLISGLSHTYQHVFSSGTYRCHSNLLSHVVLYGRHSTKKLETRQEW